LHEPPVDILGHRSVATLGYRIAATSSISLIQMTSGAILKTLQPAGKQLVYLSESEFPIVMQLEWRGWALGYQDTRAKFYSSSLSPRLS
jgi:hypothetical protein